MLGVAHWEKRRRGLECVCSFSRFQTPRSLFFLSLSFLFLFPLFPLGTTSDPSGATSTKVCHYYQNIEDSLSAYRIFFYSAINEKSMAPVKLLSTSVGSDVRRKYSPLPLGGSASLLSPAVQVSSSKLQCTVCIKITHFPFPSESCPVFFSIDERNSLRDSWCQKAPPRRFANVFSSFFLIPSRSPSQIIPKQNQSPKHRPLGKLALETIDEAETILFAIRNALQQDPSSSSVTSLSAKFYRTVPWQKEKKLINSFDALEDLCDLMQMMRDFSIREGAGVFIFHFLIKRVAHPFFFGIR